MAPKQSCGEDWPCQVSESQSPLSQGTEQPLDLSRAFGQLRRRVGAFQVDRTKAVSTGGKAVSTGGKAVSTGGKAVSTRGKAIYTDGSQTMLSILATPGAFSNPDTN